MILYLLTYLIWFSDIYRIWFWITMMANNMLCDVTYLFSQWNTYIEYKSMTQPYHMIIKAIFSRALLQYKPHIGTKCTTHCCKHGGRSKNVWGSSSNKSSLWKMVLPQSGHYGQIHHIRVYEKSNLLKSWIIGNLYVKLLAFLEKDLS